MWSWLCDQENLPCYKIMPLSYSVMHYMRVCLSLTTTTKSKANHAGAPRIKVSLCLISTPTPTKILQVWKQLF